jgi:hypothetical protein
MATKLAVAVAVAVAGCTVHRDVGSPLPHSDNDAPEGSSFVTFRLSYKISAGFDACQDQLYAQTIGDGGVQAYVQVIDSASQSVPIVPDCSGCFCSEIAPTDACSNSPPTVTELHYGDNVDWTWDGSTAPLTICGSQTCQVNGTLTPGAYLARFCHSTIADGAGPHHHVSAPTCDDVPFDYPVPGGFVTDVVTCYAP